MRRALAWLAILLIGPAATACGETECPSMECGAEEMNEAGLPPPGEGQR